MKNGDDYKKQIKEMRDQPGKVKPNFGSQQPEFKKDKKQGR